MRLWQRGCGSEIAARPTTSGVAQVRDSHKEKEDTQAGWSEATENNGADDRT